ncbi:MAG: hypothetical protein ACRDJH_26375 [Thermomicrobiales bacterium]
MATPEAASMDLIMGLIVDALARAGWQVQDRTAVNLYAGPGVAVAVKLLARIRGERAVGGDSVRSGRGKGRAKGVEQLPLGT